MCAFLLRLTASLLTFDYAKAFLLLNNILNPSLWQELHVLHLGTNVWQQAQKTVTSFPQESMGVKEERLPMDVFSTG